ncbi:hypothetical protein GCM10009117_16490 [Gangjinia marincola]|uniref:DUF4296 domain-containing protein n=2 Tax=Gangjinia marincola TaxID=578463 RepID=A0ABP3XTL0_9FLAO
MEKPDDLIAQEKMVDILTELSLLNAAKNFSKKKLEETGIQPTLYIYERYDVDSLQFAQSNNYYSEQPEQYTAIFEKVKKRLEAKKKILDSVKKIEDKRKDSIKKIEKKIQDSINVNLTEEEKKNLRIQKRESKLAPAKKENQE